MSAQIPPVSDNPTVGFGLWTDIIDNLRARDMHWLQNRAVIRFDNITAAEDYRNDADKVPGSMGVGQVVFLIGTGKLMVHRGGGTYEKVIASSMIDVAETGSGDAAVVTLSNGGSGGISLKATGVVEVVSSLNVASGKVIADSAGLKVKTGAATALFTTDGTSLLVDKPISASKLTATGSGGVVTPTLTVAGVATVGGALSAASVSTAGAVSAGSAVVAGLVAAGSVEATTVTTGSSSMNSAGVTSPTVAAGTVTATGTITTASRLTSTVAANTSGLRLSGKDIAYWGAPYDKLMQFDVDDNIWRRINSPHIQTEGGVSGLLSSTFAQQYGSFIKVGSKVVTTGALGVTGCLFDSAFPNGCLLVIPTNGDATAGTYMHMSQLTSDANGFTFACVESYPEAFGVAAGGPVVGRSVRVNYIAIGW